MADGEREYTRLGHIQFASSARSSLPLTGRLLPRRPYPAPQAPTLTGEYVNCGLLTALQSYKGGGTSYDRSGHYSLSPCAIGARYGGLLVSSGRAPGARYGSIVHILSPFARLVPATGIFSLPLCDWCPIRVYSLSPCAIGARY
eukprot:1089321-Prorocentrum_minimum.AAC.1